MLKMRLPKRKLKADSQGSRAWNLIALPCGLPGFDDAEPQALV